MIEGNKMYSTNARMQIDNPLFRRIVACAAEQKVPRPYEPWVANRMWDFASQPGWAAAYESALANGVEDPGNDASVISDGQILAAVQAIQNEETTQEEES